MKNSAPLVIVALYLRGEDLDPTDATTAIGVPPVRSQKKGDIKHGGAGKQHLVKTGSWVLASPLNSTDVSDHIRHLETLIGGKKSVISTISGLQEAYIDVFLAYETEEDKDASGEFELTSDAITVLSKLGFPLKVTVTWGKG